MENRAIIKIIGKTVREPREVNNSMELYFKISMSNKIPKGLKKLGVTFCKVNVTKKMWESLIEGKEVNKNTIYSISGEIKALTNSENKPYIVVNCMSINIDEVEEEVKIKEEVKKSNNWREKINEDELIEMNLEDIDIDYSKHKYSVIEMGDKIGINSIIAVSRKENGRYSLIVGFKAYVSSKIYRSNQPIKAYVYNGDRKSFKEEFGISY